MTHIKKITRMKKTLPKEADSGDAFFQFFFTILGIMLSAAFGDKG